MDDKLKLNIEEVLSITTDENYPREGRYIFFEDVPIDVGQTKYKIWLKWLKRGKLQCFGCGRKPDHFKLIACKSNGAIHKTGKTKHFFKLYSNGGKENGKHVTFTLDHWIPKAFLRKLKRLFGYVNVADNLVPMCEYCNRDKKDVIPKEGKWRNTTYMPNIIIGETI